MHIFRNPPELESGRLLLRKMMRRDAADMFEYSKNSDVTKFLLWSPHPDKAYTARYLAYIQSRYRSGDFYDWSIVWKDTDKMIGTCGFTRFDFDANSAEIGYVINPDFWGIGVAPEAVKLVLRFGFSELDLHRIEARYMVGNERSSRVMEKIGMKAEGVARDSMYVKGKYVSVGTYSILRDEYIRKYGG